MEIIKQGYIIKTKHYKFECVNFGCIFKCEESEIEQRQEFADGTIYLHDCPCCGVEVSVEDLIWKYW